MRDGYRNSVEKPERDKPLLGVFKATVLESECWAGKNLLRVHEVYAVVLEVLLSLHLMPLKLHVRSVYTMAV
jgi:hypothetical protein